MKKKKKEVLNWNSILWLTQVFYCYFISVPEKNLREKLLCSDSEQGLISECWNSSESGNCKHRTALIGFPLKASASAVAVEVVETTWRINAESFSSCYTDSTPMAIPGFFNPLFQGSLHFLWCVTPQSAMLMCSKHP